MPTTIVNNEGEEIEAFTSEEVQAEKDATAKANEELAEAQAELLKANEKLGKLEGKDLNFAKLREQKEDAESRVEKIKQDMEVSLGNFKKEIVEGVNKDYYTETLGGLSGDDEELKKKIEFEYNRLNDPINGKEDISKKLRDAYALATHVEDAGAFNVAAVSSGGAARPKFRQAGSFTDDEKAFGKKLGASAGISLEDKDFN